MSLRIKRGVALWLLGFLGLAFIGGCTSQTHSEVHRTRVEAPSPSPFPPDVTQLCQSIKDIEVLPFKDETVADPAYNVLVSEGEAAIPCLIRKITDETKMKDPRQAPKVGFVFVGDTAFFVLARVAKIEFVELLPLEVRKAYEGGQGMDGYFRHIDENNNRQKLQDAAVKWYEKKYGRSLP